MCDTPRITTIADAVKLERAAETLLNTARAMRSTDSGCAENNLLCAFANQLGDLETTLDPMLKKFDETV